MQRTLRGICLIVLAVTCLGAGTAAAFDLSIAWNETYGDMETNQSAYSIIQAENGSLIFAGDTDAKGAGLADAWLALLEEGNGTLLSDATYGNPLNDTAYDVIQSDNGSIVFAGSTALPLDGELYHTDAWVVGINATGDEVLNQTFGGPEVNASAHSIIQTSDGGYLFAGSIEGYESENTDAWLVKVNASGGEEWNSRFGGDRNDTANSVIEDDEGNFLFAGSTESFEAEEADGWVVKTNSTGIELWNATFGGAGNDTAQDISQENAQNFSFVGTTTFFSAENRTDTDAWYFRFNATGAPLLEVTFGGAEVNATAQAAVETPDGGRLLAGSIEDYGSGNSDAWLIKLDATADEEWNGALGGAYQDLARSIIRISETSYVFAGEFNVTPDEQPPYRDAWAVRLDEVIEPAPAPGPTPAPKPIPKAKIGDFVWEDQNGNGLQDEGEPGIKGVEVILYDSEGTELRSRATDAEGHYCFCNLNAGTYFLEFTRPEGFVFTLEKQGENPALDSDANITTGRAGPIDLTENEKDPTWDAGLVNASTIMIDVEKATNGEDADEPPGPAIPAGGVVNWTYNVTNTGLVPLFNITLEDDMLGPVSAPDGNDTILEPGDVWVYDANGTAEAGQYANIATVNATFSTAVVNDSDPSHYNGTAEIAAMIEIEKYIDDPENDTLLEADEPPGPERIVGEDLVAYVFEVTNTGDAPLSNVTVTDEGLGVELETPSSGDDDNGILDPAETWVYDLDPIDAVEGLQQNTANVTAVDPEGSNVTASDSAYYTGISPAEAAVAIQKLINGELGEEPSAPVEVEVGSSVEYTIEVTNTGGVPLSNASVTDEDLGVELETPSSGDDGNGVLDPGETWVYDLDPVEAIPGLRDNTATVTAEDPEGTTVTANVTAYYQSRPADGAAALEIEVQVDDEINPASPGPDVPVDTPVFLFFYVTNSGAVPLTNVALSADGFTASGTGEGDDDNDILDPGETWGYETSVDAVEGTQQIDAAVTADDPDENEVGASVTVYYTGVFEDGIIDGENGENGENGEPVNETDGEPINGENGEPIDGENGEWGNGEIDELINGETV